MKKINESTTKLSNPIDQLVEKYLVSTEHQNTNEKQGDSSAVSSTLAAVRGRISSFTNDGRALTIIGNAISIIGAAADMEDASRRNGLLSLVKIMMGRLK